MVNRKNNKNNYWEKPYKENLFIMKLLTTHEEFLKDVRNIRQKLDIPTNGFKTKSRKSKWALKWDKRLPGGKENLKDSRSLYFNAQNLVDKYQLRYNFLSHIENFILFGKVDAPKVNCTFNKQLNPKCLKWAHSISIKTYAPLSDKELERLKERLKELQKEFFPKKVLINWKPKITIDEALAIEEAMEERERITERIVESKYLEIIKSKVSKEEYEEILSMPEHRQKIRTEVIQITSNEIAEEFNRTPDNIRKIYSRIKEKRKELFDN